MELNVDDLFKVIGQQTVRIAVLESQLAQLQAEKDKPKEAKK